METKLGSAIKTDKHSDNLLFLEFSEQPSNSKKKKKTYAAVQFRKDKPSNNQINSDDATFYASVTYLPTIYDSK